MNEYRILDFPVWQPEGTDFAEGVRYHVAVEQRGRRLKVAHSLEGQSFIREWLLQGAAVFSVQLLYKDSSERRAYRLERNDVKDQGGVLHAIHDIAIDFSYPPKVTPSIVLVEQRKLVVQHPKSGLSSLLWKPGEPISLPAWARIACHAPLDFTSGETARLITIDCDETMQSGTMRTSVNEGAGESEKPVTLLCAKDVYDELRKIKQGEDDVSSIQSCAAALRSAIITQALSVVYAYMHRLYNSDDFNAEDINRTLKVHLEDMQEQTGMALEDENFEPGLAATQMRPYAIQALNTGEDE